MIKKLLCFVAVLFSVSAANAQLPTSLTVLQVWPFTTGAADSVAATGVLSTTPTFRHLYISTVTATTPTAYSDNYGEAFGANSFTPGDGYWRSSTSAPLSDGPGGNLRDTFYQEFLIVAATGYTVTVDSFYMLAGFFNTHTNTTIMGVYSTSHFRSDSTNIDGYTFSATGDIILGAATQLSGTITPTVANNLVTMGLGSGVVVNAGDTLTMRLYFTCGSTSEARYACVKDVMALGSIATTTGPCISAPSAFTTSSTTVCQGATGVVYTIPVDPPATSYTWSYSGTGATFTSTTNSVTINYGSSATSGTLSVIANAACGSSTPETLAITVNPTPTGGTISGGSSECVGSTLTLTDAGSSATGTWSSESPAVASVNAASGAVTGVSTGSAVIVYSVSNTCGSASATYTVNITSSASAGTITGTPSGCTGTPTILSDATGGGTWSSSNASIASVNSSGTVANIATGTVTITYSVSSGSCGSASASTSYTVSASPAAGTISGTTLICAGATSTLTDAGSTGTGSWSSSNTSIATVNASSGVVYGVASGTANITYTAITPCGTRNTSVAVTVNPSPAVSPVGGPSSLCIGSSGSYTDASTSGTWSSSNTLVATVNTSGEVTALSAGSADISYAVLTTCGTSAAASEAVIVSAVVTPVVGIAVSPATGIICAGSTVSFTATATNGGPAPSYTWVVNGTDVYSSTSNLYSYIPANGDTVSAKVLGDAGCSTNDSVGSNQITLTVDTNTIPLVSITAYPSAILNEGEDVILTAHATHISAGPYTEYQWFINGVLVPGASSPTLNESDFTNGDSASCVVTSLAPCGQSSFSYIIINVYPAGVSSVNAGISGISMFPNPNKGNFTLNGNLGTTNDEQVSVEVTDILGQVVYKNDILAKSGKLNQEITLSNGLANGIYNLSVSTANDSKVLHFVIGK